MGSDPVHMPVQILADIISPDTKIGRARADHIASNMTAD